MRRLGVNPPLLRSDSGVVIEYDPSVARDVLVREIMMTGSFEPHETKMIQDLLPEGGVFVDVGANIGYFSAVAAKAVGPTGHVHAFEPMPDTFRLLRRTVLLNGLNNVEAFNLACFSAPGQMEMTRTADSAKAHLGRGNAQNTQTVDVTTLDDFVGQRNIDRIDMLKIDAEGSDWEVLQGARSIIERLRPVTMLELDHLSEGSRSAVLQFFHAHGYKVEEIVGKHSFDLLCMPSPGGNGGKTLGADPGRAG